MNTEKKEQNGTLEQKWLLKSAETELTEAIEHKLAAKGRFKDMHIEHEESVRALVLKYSEAARKSEETIKETEDKQREEAAVVLQEAPMATRTLTTVTEHTIGLGDKDIRELKRRLQHEEIRRERAAAAAEVRQCEIYFDRDRDTAFNCGHLACGECASVLQNCHLCCSA
jgi:hypothetical protein